MPLPTPQPGETEEEFIPRCISFAVGEGMDQDQAAAACYNIWENKSEKMKKLEIPRFAEKKELFKFLHLNKQTLINQKKSEMKFADAFSFAPSIMLIGAGSAEKANEPIKNPPDILDTELVINTTNLMDTYDDVHIPGLWDKSIKENRGIMHVQEHESRKFSHIISDGDDLKVYTKYFTWRELNQEWEGKTEALMFDSMIRKSRNPFMHDQYSKGYVRQHSVGMRYVQLALAINDKNYGAEFEVWEKYFDIIANKEDADELGYFWAVREAKVIEGSAVPKGANWVTPTRNNNKFEPPEGTQLDTEEPPEGTPKLKSFNELLSNQKFF